jgi:hypothetical protein
VRPLLQILQGALRAGQEDLAHEALLIFFAFPQFALAKHSGAPALKGIKSNLFKIIEGALPKPSPSRGSDPDKREQQEEEADFLTPAQLAAVKAAVRLAQQGLFKKAIQALERCGSNGILDPTPQVIQKLISLHPQPSWLELPPVPESAPRGLQLSNSTLKKASRAIANGSSPDIWGWSGELMAVLMNDHACREAIKELVCLVRDDALPARARDCMLASWLVALPKADNGCRPIAGGTVVTKLAVCCSMITCDKAVTETFAEHGLQFGIGSPDGCLTASRLTQLVLEADPKHIVLKLDIKHAFQNTSRAKC